MTFSVRARQVASDDLCRVAALSKPDPLPGSGLGVFVVSSIASPQMLGMRPGSAGMNGKASFSPPPASVPDAKFTCHTVLLFQVLFA